MKEENENRTLLLEKNKRNELNVIDRVRVKKI